MQPFGANIEKDTMEVSNCFKELVTIFTIKNYIKGLNHTNDYKIKCLLDLSIYNSLLFLHNKKMKIWLNKAKMKCLCGSSSVYTSFKQQM